jgi:Holliday junction resolvasome RuvABC endonuclease subunit
MNVLALDLATRTGWADALCGSVRSGYRDFPEVKGEAPGTRFVRFRNWLREMVDTETPPELVVIEKPLIGTMKNADVARIAFGFAAITEEVCARFGVRFYAIHNATVKKHATGSGNADKRRMTAAANTQFEAKIGREIIDNNEADALCVLAWVEDGMPEATPAPRKPRKKKLHAPNAGGT